MFIIYYNFTGAKLQRTNVIVRLAKDQLGALSLYWTPSHQENTTD